MLQKIPTKEIMTTREAVDKYPSKYFDMVITKVVDGCDNDLGYVTYIADKHKEMLQVPMKEYGDLKVALMYGDEVEPYPSFGGVYYD